MRRLIGAFNACQQNSTAAGAGLIQHARLVRRDHVLDVDECIFASVPLQQLQSLLNQIADIHALALAVRYCVANVDVLALENIENG